MGIGSRIRELREERGLGQAELARRVGIYRNSLYRFERDLQVPSATMVERIARALGVKPGALFAPDGDRAEEPALAGKAEAPAKPGEAEAGQPSEEKGWVSTPDLDVFGRRLSELSTDDLKYLGAQLLKDVPWKPRSLEDLRNEPISESAVRNMNFARANLVQEELLRRGEEPLAEFVPALRQWLEALTSPQEPRKTDAHKEREVG